jgi:hypothetical protein
MKKMNEAVDQIRRAEQVNCREDFKRTRYWWLRNAEKLKQEQIKRIESLSRA